PPVHDLRPCTITRAKRVSEAGFPPQKPVLLFSSSDGTDCERDPSGCQNSLSLSEGSAPETCFALVMRRVGRCARGKPPDANTSLPGGRRGQLPCPPAPL